MTAEVVFQSFLFLLEMDHISTQAVFFLTFNVPCVQNQNQSVHLLVPDEVYICKGLISKSSPVQLIFTDMYIQISQPQISSVLAKKKPTLKVKSYKKVQIKQYISLLK